MSNHKLNPDVSIANPEWNAQFPPSTNSKDRDTKQRQATIKEKEEQHTATP
jgi:hypothetical protein